MSARSRRGWAIFLAGAAAGLAGLGLLTLHAQRAARARTLATAEAQHQEDVRTALYRMEQRLAPLVARALGRSEASEEVAELPSLRLVLPDGGIAVDPLAAAPPETLVAQARSSFDELAPASVAPPADWIASNDVLGSNIRQLEMRAIPRSGYEYTQRANIQNLSNSNRRLGPVLAGSVVAGWQPRADGGRDVAFVRCVETTDAGRFEQTLRVDWAALAPLLLDEVDDLFVEAKLEPVEGAAAPEDGARLVGIPARLVATPSPRVRGEDGELLATTISTWVLALLAFAAATWAFRTSQRDATRQREFTSAVTHELRTPLTTFRMYSEMLARDMVPPERRAEYLAALEEESRRLGTLVENVLAHARLEEGRAPARREDVAVRALVERSESSLARRCADAGTRLAVELGEAGAAAVRTDPDAVAMILANLVDNACKYGAPAGGHREDAPVRIEARADAAAVVLTVRDAGPGVPKEAARAIFRPFERAGRDASDPAHGVGLGLALARNLARAAGGELVLVESAGPGAAFELRLPRGAGA